MNKTHRSSKLVRPGNSSLVVGMVVASLAALLSGPESVRAVGFRLPNQDPEAIARGNAYVATADNPSAIYYNPAGITQLGSNQMRAGIYVISADTEYTSPTGAKAETGTTPQAVPQLYYTHSFEKAPVSVGLGVYAPFGLGLRWRDNPQFNTIANNGKLVYATVSPVVAWQVHPKFSIAAGPTISYADVDLESPSFKFRGNDVAPGAKAGLLWQPVPQLSFGASYQSATDLEFSGHSRNSLPGPFGLSRVGTTAEAHIPQFAVVGVSYRPTPDWNFEFDLDWTDWDSFNTITFKRDDGVSLPFPFKYESSFMYEFGVTRQLGKGWYGSLGYIYSENSAPDSTYNPLVNDDNLHLGSVGFGRHGKRWDWSVAYHFAYNGTRTVSGSQSALGPVADGKYETFNHAVNVAATFKF